MPTKSDKSLTNCIPTNPAPPATATFLPLEWLLNSDMDRIKESGGNAFRDYMLPQAVLSFKQGFGRLIRSKTDTGLVIVTDQRLVGKSYGSSFIKSLPDIPMLREIVDIPKIKK